MNPLVSVLVPAYRAEATLAATLESVLAQTYPNVEVVVVDDGSPDGTLAVAQSFEARGVRVIGQPNGGAASARNHAFRESTGAFIQFLDADDLLAPDKIEVQMRRLVQEPPGTVASAAWARFQTDPAAADFSPKPDWKDFDPAADWLVQSWTGRGTMFPAAWLLPRPIVERAGPWNESLSLDDDGEYNARVLTEARKVAFCPEARAYYRSGSGSSLSARRDAAAMASQRRATELCAERLLAYEDSGRTRHAAACRWQALAHLAFQTNPPYPDLVREAENRAAALGGGTLVPGVSRPLRIVRDVWGWKSALRLQAIWYRYRYG